MIPPNQTAQSPFNIQDLIALFQQGQQQQAVQQGQNQAQAQQAQLQRQREALMPQHLGMSGGMINPTTGAEAGNPFDNGFFKSNDQRAQVEQQRLGYDGASTASPAQAVDPNILQPGAAFNFMPPDNTFDQQVTAPNPFASTSPQFPQAAINRTNQAMNTLKQRPNRFAF